MNCKTISSRTQKWSNSLYPQLFNLKGRPIRMITQNRSAFSLPSPISHEVLHQSEKRRLWTHNRLRKGWKKPPMNDTPWFNSLTQLEKQKKKNVTPSVSSWQLKTTRLRRYVQSLSLGLKKFSLFYWFQRKGGKQLLQCNTGCSRRRERKGVCKQIPPRPPFTHPKQLTYPRLSLPSPYNPSKSFPFPPHWENSPFGAPSPPLAEHFIPAEISDLSNFSSLFP